MPLTFTCVRACVHNSKIAHTEHAYTLSMYARACTHSHLHKAQQRYEINTQTSGTTCSTDYQLGSDDDTFRVIACSSRRSCLTNDRVRHKALLATDHWRRQSFSQHSQRWRQPTLAQCELNEEIESSIQTKIFASSYIATRFIVFIDVNLSKTFTILSLFLLSLSHARTRTLKQH